MGAVGRVAVAGLSGLRKQAGRLTSTSALAQGSGPSRSVLWNLGLAQTALGKLDEARLAGRLVGFCRGVPAARRLGPGAAVASDDRTVFCRASLGAAGRSGAARILSVVRYGASCQFGDVVLCDTQGQGSFCDGLTGSTGKNSSPRSRRTAWSLEPIESAGYALHVVQGPAAASPSQAMSLTERLREHGPAH